jgi:hypothetical protein
MGSRVGVNVAFSCKSVSEGLGQDVRSTQPEWTAQFFGTHEGKDRHKHRLTDQFVIPGDLAWEIEHTVMEQLRDRSLPFHDRVRCALLFLRLGTTGDPLAKTAAIFREAIAAGTRKQLAKVDRSETLDPTQRALFRQWLFLLHNPTPITFHERPADEQDRVKAELVAAGEAFCEGKGPFWMGGEPFPADVSAIDAVDVAFLRGTETAFLETFFCAKIIGQKFLMSGPGELPLVEGLRRLLLYYPMIAWTAKAFAARRGAAAVAEQDVRRATRSLDQTIGLHDMARLPRKLAEAMKFIVMETPLVEAAMNDVLGPGARG